MTTVLVTGSSRGIGAAIVAALDAPGITVLGHSTRGRSTPGQSAPRQSTLDQSARDQSTPDQPAPDGPARDVLAADFAEPAAARDLWRRALDRAGGRIDVLVNNAGVFDANPIDRDDDPWVAEWERTMRINLTAGAELCRLAIRHWHAAGSGGRIVNVASRAAYRGDSPAHWHYAASKAGMVAMTKSIARGYARDGILAFAVCPGFTMTGMAEEYLASRGGDALLADIPLGRVAMPDEVGEMVRWLALDAPASMTGAVLDVNGASYVR